MARNTGASQATADLLIFYDDDMVPYSDSVEKHIIFHCNHEGIVCGHPFETTEPHHTDIQNYKAWLTHKWTGRYSDGITTMNTDDLFFTASNCSITKAIFNTLKGFDDNLTDAEDYELAYRCLGLGISVYYDKENLARHADSITCRGYIQRLREYGRAHKKIADTSQHHPAPNTGLVSVPRRIVYRCFAFAFWPKIIDAGALRFLPKNFRYRLYSIIIHALANEHANVSL